MTLDDLRRNIKEENPAVINSIKEGYILNGYSTIIEIIKNVTNIADQLNS